MSGARAARPAAQQQEGRAGRILRWVGPAAAIVVVVAAFLPWTVSGSAARHSFATVRSARLLGLGDHPVLDVVLGAWYFVPAVAGLACLAAVLGRRRLAGAACAVVGAAAVIAAVAVLRAPLGIGVGVPVALVAGAVALVAGLRDAVLPRRTA